MISVENNFGVVNVYVRDPSLLEQVQAGADAESLHEIGYEIESDAEETLIEDGYSTIPDEEIDRLEHIAKEAEEEYQEAILRSVYLKQVAGRGVGRVRKYEGFLVNTEREPDDRKRLEKLYPKTFDETSVILRRACGHCALRKNCTIVKEASEDVTEEQARHITLRRWIKRHPYANKAPTKEQESRTDFLDRLEQDPLAHCRPPRKKTN